MRLSDWRRLSELSGPDSMRLQLLLWKVNKPSYDEWAELVERCIEHVITLIALRKNDLQNLAEDALTSHVTGNLSCIGLNAISARVGGNCDVTVSYNNEYFWLGEAKIFTGAAHVWDGYLQLRDRYNTGIREHSRGGMLLYCYKDSVDVLLAEWKETLSTQEQQIAINESPRQMAFLSEDTSPATGGVYSVTHFGLPLFHSPKDGKIKLRADAISAGRKAKKSAKDALSKP